MDEIRFFLAVCFSGIGFYLIYDLIANGFDFFVFIAIPFLFVVAHFLLPKKNNSDSNVILDLLEFVVDLPYRLVAKCLRSIGADSVFD